MQNENNDTISREALKEDMKSRLSVCNEWIEKAKDKETRIRASAVKAYLAEVIMTIDNAPTVAVDEEIERQREELYQESKKLFDTARMLGVERPQGKWNEIQAGMFVCPFCGARPHKDFKNFCAKCGAKMQKEGAE